MTKNRLILIIILSGLFFVGLLVNTQMGLQAQIKQSTTAFAILKAGNAVISVFQESTISINFIVGGELAIGQMLDPVNDLVEKSSNLIFIGLVMYTLIYIVTLAFQSILFKILLTALFLGCITLIYIKKNDVRLIRLPLLLLALPFAVVLLNLFSQSIHHAVVDTSEARFFKTHQTIIPQKEYELGQPDKKLRSPVQDSVTASPKSLFKNLFSAQTQRAAPAPAKHSFFPKTKKEFKQLEQEFKLYFEHLLDYIVRYMVSIILQSIVVPLGIFFLMKKVVLNQTAIR